MNIGGEKKKTIFDTECLAHEFSRVSSPQHFALYNTLQLVELTSNIECWTLSLPFQVSNLLLLAVLSKGEKMGKRLKCGKAAYMLSKSQTMSVLVNEQQRAL